MNVTQDQDVPDSKTPEDTSPDLVEEELENTTEQEPNEEEMEENGISSLPRLRETLPAIDLATDALHNEMSDSLYNLIPSHNDTSYDDEVESSQGASYQGQAYAQNLDLHLASTVARAASVTGEPSRDSGSNRYEIQIKLNKNLMKSLFF